MINTKADSADQGGGSIRLGMPLALNLAKKALKKGEPWFQRNKDTEGWSSSTARRASSCSRGALT